MTKEKTLDLEDLFSGGDLRSTGAADTAADQLHIGKWTVQQFFSLVENGDPVVRMRAADALE